MLENSVESFLKYPKSLKISIMVKMLMSNLRNVG